MKNNILLAIGFIFTLNLQAQEKAQMEPPAITSLNTIGGAYRIHQSTIVRSYYSIIPNNANKAIILRHSPTILYKENKPYGALRSEFLNVNDGIISTSESWTGNFEGVYMLETEGSYFVLFGTSDTDSCLVLNENLELERKIGFNAKGIQEAKIFDNKLFILAKNNSTFNEELRVFSLDGALLNSFELKGEVNEIYTTSDQLIVCTTKSVSIINKDLVLTEIKSEASSFVRNENTIIGVNPESNTWKLNIQTLGILNLGENIDQAFAEVDNPGFYLKKGTSLIKYNENNIEELQFTIPEDTLEKYKEPTVTLVGDFFVVTEFLKAERYQTKYSILNASGNVLFQDYTFQSTQSNSILFNSGNLLFGYANGLIKINKEGDLIWERTYSIPDGDIQFIMEPDDSFYMIIRNGDDQLLHFENDEARCSYEATNPIPSELCTPTNEVSHQVLGKIRGNNTIKIEIFRDYESVKNPYLGLGFDFTWIKDGVKDTTHYWYDIEPNHAYKLEIKQGACVNTSDEVTFKHAPNMEILNPRLSSTVETAFIGDTVTLSGSCDDSYRIWGSRTSQDKWAVNPNQTTTYELSCLLKYSRINTRPWGGDPNYYRDFLEIGECQTEPISVEIIIYDPATVLATEEESPAIKLFPNPVSQYFQIQAPSNTVLQKLEIFNTSGELIQSFSKEEIPQSRRIRIDENMYPSGVYVLKLRHDGKVWSQKVVMNR